MVQPDRSTPEKRPRQQPRYVVVGAGVVVFVLAAFTVGRLTAPEIEEAAPTTTEPAIATPVTSTTTTVFDPDDFRLVDVANGPPVVWARVHGVPSTFPVELVSHEGRVFLFGTAQPWWAAETATGLEGWSTIDGVFWSGLGELIGPEYRTSSVVSTELGLIALGENLPEAEPALWIADDISSWTKVMLPMPRELSPGEYIGLTTAAASGDTLIVFGNVSQNPERAAAEYLPDEIATLAGEYGMGYGAESLQIQAPFGITVFSATLQELDIPAEIWGRLSTGGPDEIYVWMSTDRGVTWTTAPFEESRWVHTTAIDDEGTIDVIGESGFGPTRWTSADGEVWGSNIIPGNVQSPVPWQEGFAAVWSGLEGEDVALSKDGVTWSHVGISTFLPGEIFWRIWPLMADDSAGLAAVVSGYGDGTSFTQPTPYVDKDGYRISVDYNEGQIAIYDLEAERIVATIPVQTGNVGEYTIIDLSGRSVTFLDPETEEPLVTVAFSELGDAEDAAWSQANAARPLRGFFYSADGEQWSLQDMTEWFGTDDVMHIAAANDRLIAVTLDEFWYRSDTPQSRLWMGILPDR